jgi:hypothetical protein
MESEMAIVKIGRALCFRYGIVSCVLFACVNVAGANLGGDQIIGDAAHRTVQSSKSKDDLAGGGPLHLFRSSEHKDQYGTEKPVRRKKRNF